ncbi:hypothetical protein MMYC01_207444 [Madurella mycetomatis]|uniref:Uncharacterized protein n=1 Tax=Madurella mycetomatis TaxID=100816 RepID=A0A175VXP7_9PEZI|nr:hypothetical protein MMYC01_207444 [Madurella mycetomatis]
MPSYVITGVSRGIGYEFLRQCSSDPNNTVIGLVRNKAVTDKKVSEDPDLNHRSNVHILEADITDYKALKQAVVDTSRITGGSLDYLIANAGIVTSFDAYDPIGVLGDRPDELTKTLRDLFETNAIGNVHLFNLFIPLILNGQAKKVITISSGLADAEFTNKYDVTAGPLYSASKAAMNMIVAKFSAQYKKDGVLFLALSPGFVDVGHYKNATPEQIQNVEKMVAKFVEYAPHFKGPDTPEQSVTALRSVIKNASIEKGNGGDFLSHYGNKQWL